MKKYTLTAILALGFLAACGPNRPETIEISTSPVEKPTLVVPSADSLNLRTVRWTILTPENFDEKISVLFSRGTPVVLFALTENGYENLSLNLNDLRTYIEQQKRIIVAYENYYKRSEAALDEANTILEQSYMR